MEDTTWQEAYVANLHTMITALDEHVTKEDAIRILLEQVDELKPGTTLDGATNEPAPHTEIATAGEFAARWNTWTPDQRDAVWVQIRKAADDGYKCFMEDHEGLKEQLAAANLRILGFLQGAEGKAQAEAWIIEYAHPNCQFCEGAAEEAIAHAKETGAPGATAVGIAMDGNMTPTDHAATVVRA
ncbi:hypothetical protein SEA_NEFERTHENA_59 [Microbacterium phage Neferthena]|uniref:Uncharacterized protein n=1 Tax=Microbacterium phage Neferthena TaxID=2301539 RepID=A0A385D3H5_9CAUD|nr:hypothetical protein HOT92_gp43 [Microbacterium phage Neferthena]AXQ52922.1 hypothetical protein SEA_NEFERTHENA_59 [Microbacterium phage Neferthena]